MRGADLTPIRSFLSSGDFYDETRGRAYAEALRLEAAGVAPDVVTLASALRDQHTDGDATTLLDRLGGIGQLQVFYSECPTPRNAQHYAELIAAAAARRAGRDLPKVTTPRPVIEKVGLGYRTRFAAGVDVRVDRLRESHGELSGELSVRWSQPGLPGQDGHIYRGRFNLSSLTARASATRFLNERTRGAEVPWSEVLERFCVAVLDAHRDGEPTVVVGQDPVRDAMPSLFEGGFLLEGLGGILYGAGGEGKTTLAVAVLVSSQTGTEIVPGLRPTLTLPWLWLDYEGSREIANELIAKIAAGAGIAPPAVRYKRCHRPLPEMVEELAAECQDHGIGGLLIDSVERGAGASSSGEGFNDRAGRFNAAVDQICAATGATPHLIDHVSGDDVRMGGAAAKPINGIMKVNWARGTFFLKREREPSDDRAEFVVIDKKRNYRAKLPDLKMAIVYEPGRIRFERVDHVSAPDLAPLVNTAADRIAAYLAAGEASPRDVAEQIGLSQDVVRVTLNRGKGRRFVQLQNRTWGLLHHE